MSDPSFELKSFEHIEAIPGQALLRIAAAPGFDPQACALLLDGVDRVMPLPAPPGPPGVARVAFSVPAERFASATDFTLELDGDSQVGLPAPSVRVTARIPRSGAGLSGPAPMPAPLPDGPAPDVVAELERRLGDERTRRMSADTAAATSAAARAASATRLSSLDVELADARSSLAAVQTDLDGTRDDLAGVRDELVGARDELAGARDELRAAQGEAELRQTYATHARAEAEAAEATLIERAAEITLLRQTVTEGDAHAQSSYLEWEQITAELSAEVQVARQLADQSQAHAGRLALQLADTRLELSSLAAVHAAGEAVLAGGGPAGDDPSALVARLNAAAAALESERARALAAEAELDRLRAAG